LLLTLFNLRPELSQQRSIIWSVAGLLFSAISVVIVNSWLSVLAHSISFLLVLGFVQSRELRFVWFALGLGVLSLFQGPIRWISSLARTNEEGEGTANPVSPWLKQIFLPILIILPFLFLYTAANSVFAQYITWLLDNLADSANHDRLWLDLLLFGVGNTIAIAFFFPRLRPSRLAQLAAGFKDELVRKRQIRGEFLGHHNLLALKNEYRRGVLTFAALNTLLLFVNLTDLRYVWLDTSELPAARLSEYVHIGTFSLLLSIFLAMGVVLFFFRGNLNFYPGVKPMRQLANIWLVQNAILALSVAIRNFHYINEYGLARGRIAVAFLIPLIGFGLFTLFRKINWQLSLSYLFQVNGLAVWLWLLFFAAINWDGIITRYNLSNQAPSEVDWVHLTNLSERNTFLLNQPKFRPHLEDLYVPKLHPDRYKQTDWRSWNYSDWRNYKSFSK